MAPLADADDWGDYSSTAPPANVATLLDAASGAIRTYCGWSISEEDVDEVVDTDGSALLMLPTLLLTAVDEVVIDDEELVLDEDYIWSAKGIVRRQPRGRCWPEAYQSTAIAWTHGYDPVPAEIKAIVVGLAARFASAPAGGVVEEQVGQIRVRYGEGSTVIAPDIYERAVLDRYRLPPGP